jgi:Tol biopolymer transport system component
MNEDGSQKTALIEGVSRDVSWSPDGRSIAYSLYDGGGFGTILIADLGLSNGSPVVVGTRDLQVPHTHSPSWSPLGDVIAYPGACDPGEPDGTCPPEGYTNHIRAVPAAGGLAYTIYETPNCSDPWDCLVPFVAWSPDGSQIAFVEVTDQWTVTALRIVDVSLAPTSDSQVLIDPGTFAGICRPDWSPNGSRIAFWARETDGSGAALFDYDVGSAAPPAPLGLTSRYGCEDVTWSADGTRWAVSLDGAVRIVDADRSSSAYGQVIPRRKSKLASGYSPDWRPCEAGSANCGLSP